MPLLLETKQEIVQILIIQLADLGLHYLHTIYKKVLSKLRAIAKDMVTNSVEPDHIPPQWS